MNKERSLMEGVALISKKLELSPLQQLKLALKISRSPEAKRKLFSFMAKQEG